jgi:hypothetical protein
VSKATIVINFKKTPWPYENNFVADASIAKVNPEKTILPGELFTQQKNLTQLFPASESRQVSEKATGKITIYNAYSAASQILVPTTRFLTPDGKVFRLTDQVVVPGAEVKDGKITPGSIEAGVIADRAGPDYNVGPVSRLTIPGFKGTPRYEKFYGELRTPASGGFVGKKPVPSAQDIASAKARVTDILKSSLESGFSNSRPAGFTILDGASEVKTTKLTVNENTDSKGNFSIFGEAAFRALGFRDADLRSFLESKAFGDNPGTIFEDLKLDYANVQQDLDHGRLNFSLKVNGTLRPAFSVDDFRSKVTGRSVEEARSAVLGLSGLSGAKISLWPLWLRSIPKDSSRVTVIVP